MKCTVDAQDLRATLTGCNKAASKDDVRPILQRTRIVVTDDEVVLTALDGFRMVEYTLPATDAEPGVVQVYAGVLLPLLKGRGLLVTLAVEAGRISLHSDDAPDVTLVLPDQVTHINTAHIWPKPGREAARIRVNPRLLVQTAQALGNAYIDMDVPLDPLEPILLTSRGGADVMGVRAIVMPLRVVE